MINNTKIMLSPGEIYADVNPAKVWMVLGSCVAIAMYDKKKHIGTVCHGQLPERRLYGVTCRDNCPHKCDHHEDIETEFKYITCSFDHMKSFLMSAGSKKEDLVVSIIGGSSLIDFGHNKKSIGTENVEVARRVVKDFGLRIHYEDVLGDVGRTIDFDTEKGLLVTKLQRKKA